MHSTQDGTWTISQVRYMFAHLPVVFTSLRIAMVTFVAHHTAFYGCMVGYADGRGEKREARNQQPPLSPPPIDTCIGVGRMGAFMRTTQLDIHSLLIGSGGKGEKKRSVAST